MAATEGLPPWRSYLFVPGDRPERFVKALDSGADCVIFDLEDAVTPAAKARARDNLANAQELTSRGIVRINAPGTSWYDDDIALCTQCPPLAVIVPKAEDVAELARLAARLPRPTAILPLIESARGLHAVKGLAAVERVARLVFGSLDLQLDLGMEGEEELNPFRSQLVLASRLAAIHAPVDGVTVTLDDASQLAADTARSRRLGFSGKLCIHPRQVAVVNGAFVPGPDELRWAEKVVKAASESPAGAVSVEGAMIDKPVLARAERLLALAKAFGRQ